MAVITMRGLSERTKEVFKFIVGDYITSGEPVGSRRVAKQSGMGLSPATIRNEMADLGERGLLYQPHTSAGRVPTERGFRFFIDDLLDLTTVPARLKRQIERECLACPGDTCQVMRVACRALSALTSYPAIVLGPLLEESIITHIEFIRFKKNHVLVIFVASSGLVQNRIVQIESDLSQDELDRMSAFVGNLLTGLPLRRVRQRIVGQLRRDRQDLDELFHKALDLGGMVLMEGDGRDVYIEGQTMLLDAPEFSDVGKMKELFRAFEEKTLLVELLDRSMRARGVQVVFGSECAIAAVDGCSIVTAPYGHDDPFVGILGVLGPIRMDYARVIPMVDYTAQLLTAILESEWNNR
jgi:heat-inducible transcriptional repressor